MLIADEPLPGDGRRTASPDDEPTPKPDDTEEPRSAAVTDMDADAGEPMSVDHAPSESQPEGGNSPAGGAGSDSCQPTPPPARDSPSVADGEQRSGSDAPEPDAEDVAEQPGPAGGRRQSDTTDSR
jgi:hypothetical protein